MKYIEHIRNMNDSKVPNHQKYSWFSNILSIFTDCGYNAVLYLKVNVVFQMCISNT